jgi:hypothetical protein
LQYCTEEIFEIALGVSIAKQGRAYILNCDRKFFAKWGFQIFSIRKKKGIELIMNIGIVTVIL